MSGRLARIVVAWLPSLSARRREWVQAALAELPELPTGFALQWSLGLLSIAVADLAEQAFLPWRRDPDARPPAGFAALIGLICLLAPLYLLLSWLLRPGWGASSAGLWLGYAGLLLCLYLNAAAVLKSQPLGGLHYAVSLRVLPHNLALLVAALALAAAI